MNYNKYLDIYLKIGTIISTITASSVYINSKLFILSVSVYILTAFAMVFLASPILKQFKIPKSHTSLESMVNLYSSNKTNPLVYMTIAFIIEALILVGVLKIFWG